MKKQIVVEIHSSEGGDDSKMLANEMAGVFLKFVKNNGLELVSYSKGMGCL